MSLIGNHGGGQRLQPDCNYARAAGTGEEAEPEVAPEADPAASLPGVAASRRGPNTASTRAAAISPMLTASAACTLWPNAAASACAPGPAGCPAGCRVPNRTVPTTAIPSALPTRCAVLSTPLADPLSEGRTDFSTRSMFGATIIPWPSPVSSSGPTRYQPLGAPLKWKTSSSEVSPAATMPQPRMRTHRPRRWAMTLLLRAVTMAPRANGLTTRPLASASWPKPSCQVTASQQKNM